MNNFWTVIGAIAAVFPIYLTGFKRGEYKVKKAIMDDRRKARFDEIYAPANALFLDRHITTARFIGARHFRQRLKNSRAIWSERRKLRKAVSAIFDKQESELLGEVEHGKVFPLFELTKLVERNIKFADSKLVDLVAAANRAKYELRDERLLSNEELNLYDHVWREHRKLSRLFS